jgi:hypothetical protein
MTDDALALAFRTGLPYVGLRGLAHDPDLDRFIPPDAARSARVVPLAADDDHVRIAAAGPEPDLASLEPYLGDRRVEIAIAPADELEAILGPPPPPALAAPSPPPVAVVAEQVAPEPPAAEPLPAEPAHREPAPPEPEPLAAEPAPPLAAEPVADEPPSWLEPPSRRRRALITLVIVLVLLLAAGGAAAAYLLTR